MTENTLSKRAITVQCKRPGCCKLLRSDNKIGLCQSHRHWIGRSPSLSQEEKNRRAKVYMANKRIANPDQVRQQDRDRYYRNRQVRIRISVETKRKARIADPSLRAIDALRSRLYSFFKGKKSKNTQALVGCTWKSLRNHLRSQWAEGMSWENYGSGWHIDHKYPLSLVNLDDAEAVAKACHFTNLQPLWATDNIKKSNKVA